jgi:hypothetical protein
MSRRALAAAALWLASCLPSVEPIVSCQAQGSARPLCGYQNPEDLVALPGGRSLLVSEYGGMDRGDPGALSRLDLATETRSVLFRGGYGASPSRGWGDPGCPGMPETLSPHGIDLVHRDDGRTALLVVNHAGRESVELFEVLDPSGSARLEWRGCAVPPAGSWLNDVAGRRDGGFLASQMMPKREGVGQALELLKAALFGVATGHVVAWSSDTGFGVVPGSQTVLPNGVALSRDESRVFINSTLGGTVRAVEIATGRTLGEADVALPDNSTWGPDGRLWVASLRGSVLEIRACDDLPRGACPIGFAIVAVDPEHFTTEVMYAGDGITMGAGTVGVPLGAELFVGSFAGDRILRVALGGL